MPQNRFEQRTCRLNVTHSPTHTRTRPRTVEMPYMLRPHRTGNISWGEPHHSFGYALVGETRELVLP